MLFLVTQERYSVTWSGHSCKGRGGNPDLKNARCCRRTNKWWVGSINNFVKHTVREKRHQTKHYLYESSLKDITSSFLYVYKKKKVWGSDPGHVIGCDGFISSMFFAGSTFPSSSNNLGQDAETRLRLSRTNRNIWKHSDEREREV